MSRENASGRTATTRRAPRRSRRAGSSTGSSSARTRSPIRVSRASTRTSPSSTCLDMFPYPSGAGLHVGHPEGYAATDILCRYKRMRGVNVLHPMGWDAFGLPAEQYAIQTNVHPAITTRKAIETSARQLKRFGFSLRLGARVRHDRPGLLPLDAVDLPADLRRAGSTASAAKRVRSTELVAEFASGARAAALQPRRGRDRQRRQGASRSAHGRSSTPADAAPRARQLSPAVPSPSRS